MVLEDQHTSAQQLLVQQDDTSEIHYQQVCIPTVVTKCETYKTFTAAQVILQEEGTVPRVDQQVTGHLNGRTAVC